MEENPWNKRFNPGDLVLLIAQFKDNRPRHGLVIREYSPQVNPGYEILLDGKVKYFPPHLTWILNLEPILCRHFDRESKSEVKNDRIQHPSFQHMKTYPRTT